MERDPASNFVHFFQPKLNLLCGYVGARVGWATRPEQVDCPACLERLARLERAAAASAAMVRGAPPRSTPLPVNPGEERAHPGA